MEKHVERMISIVYRAHKIRGKSKDSENKGISSVEGEFYRSICHFARCNYIDAIFEFHKIEMERIFSNEKRVGQREDRYASSLSRSPRHSIRRRGLSANFYSCPNQ